MRMYNNKTTTSFILLLKLYGFHRIGTLDRDFQTSNSMLVFLLEANFIAIILTASYLWLPGPWKLSYNFISSSSVW